MVDEPHTIVTEIVSMLADGRLSISESVVVKNVSPGVTVWKAEPGSKDFVEFQSRHGVSKVGQCSTIRKELRAGAWTEMQTKEGDWS